MNGLANKGAAGAMIGLLIVTAGGASVAFGEDGQILSANFGADNAFGQAAGLAVCQGASGLDGIPVVFSEELGPLPSPSDFRVLGENGDERPVTCLTFDPADDPGERRTLLLVGEFGSASNQPRTVEVVGQVWSKDFTTAFRGAAAPIARLEATPALVKAEPLPRGAWDLDDPGSPLQWGGGTGCPHDGTRQVIRTVWGGGVRAPDGGELTEAEWSSYTVTLRRADGAIIEATPFALGDLNDRDNNHELCLTEIGVPVAVTFEAGFVADPNGDLNDVTSVMVTKSR